MSTAQGCLFCGVIAGEVPAQVVWRTNHAVAFLDHSPLFFGHTLVVPTTHWVTLTDVPPGAMGELMQVVSSIASAVERATSAEGYFIAMNNRVSQSVPHLHVHVVPRRKKDGLKGFFWPRKKYGEGEAATICERIQRALEGVAGCEREPIASP